MKRHAALVLLLLLPTVSAPADAQPPGSARAPRGGPPDGPGGPGGPGGRRDPFREMFGRPGPSASAPHPGHSGGPHGMGHGHGPFHGAGVPALVKQLRAGTITRAEFDTKFKELRSTIKERRKAHQSELRERFDATVLRSAPFKEELRIHARRMAFLNRAQVVAQSELTGDKQKKTLARIDKLIELESQRHEKAVARIKGGDAPTPPGSAIAAASAAPAASAAQNKETP